MMPDRQSRTKGREATKGVIPGRFALSVGKPQLPAPHGWRWVPLSEVAQLESGHTPSRRSPEYWSGGVPWIGIPDAVQNHGRTIVTTHATVSALGLDNSSARVLPAQTVCLSRTASVGYVVVMGCPMATSQDFVNWVCGPSLDPEYLKYILLGERDSLLRFASGTTHQTIYYPEAKAFHGLLPHIAIQKRIVRILGALDDKIELNRRANETLEAMVWTVVESRTAAEEWPSTSLAEAGVGLLDCEHRTPPAAPSGYPYIAIPQIRGGRLVLDEVRLISAEDYADWTRRTCPRAHDVIVVRRCNPGDVAVVPEGLQAALGQNLVILRANGHRVLPRVLSWLTRGAAWRQQVDKFINVGAVFDSLRCADIPKFCVPVPSLASQQRLLDEVGAHEMAIERNRRESRTLATLRDTLLPKLLSGDLRIPEAERAIESAL